MKYRGNHYRTIWLEGSSVFMIDQKILPFKFHIHKSGKYKDTIRAIRDMTVRGSGAVGAAAGYAMAQAFIERPKGNWFKFVTRAKKEIELSRPSIWNLHYSVDKVYSAGLGALDPEVKAVEEAESLANENAESAMKIGELGNNLIKNNSSIMTHSNAGWLAVVDYGTALSPIYEAHRVGKKILVYVSETRPTYQGSKLTAWELGQAKVPYSILVDGAAATLFAKKRIDLVLVGADRIASNGDVINKLGTLDKAILAWEQGIPFYVAAPTSTFDLNLESGNSVEVEERDKSEVTSEIGLNEAGELERILNTLPSLRVFNPAYDITPATYISGIITEKGIIIPNKDSISRLFNPEKVLSREESGEISFL